VNQVFADTFFFLALLNGGDPMHELALAKLRSQPSILTTEFILLEMGNACARADDHADFLTLVEGMRDSARVTIVPLDSNLFDRGLRLMASRPDKNWSLTDCISFVVMKERSLSDALTADRHFEQAGFRALMLA
jgi:predicted nucleic acid-binding protein